MSAGAGKLRKKGQETKIARRRPHRQDHYIVGELEETPGLRAGVADAAVVAQLCRGQSNRPGDMPAINPRYLSEETDRRAIIGGLQLARRISPHRRCSSLSGTRACPAGMSRRRMSCLIPRGAAAARAITPAAPA
jgi:hypothetical protein